MNKKKRLFYEEAFKQFIPLLLAAFFGICCAVQQREFIDCGNLLLNYGSAALIALTFGGICACFCKNKKSAIIKGAMSFAFAAITVFAVTPVLNGDYSIKDIEALQKKVSGFEEIPIDEIGIIITK